MYQCTKSHCQKCFVVYTLVIVVLARDDYDAPLYRLSLLENLVQASYRQKCLSLFVVVYKLVILALT